MTEPLKYVQNEKSAWVLSEEWKEWRKNKLQRSPTKPIPIPAKTKRNTVGRLTPIIEEEHKPNWKAIAWFPGSEKQILFCACRSNTGIPYSGCGAVAIQLSRGGKMHIVVESRFQ